MVSLRSQAAAILNPSAASNLNLIASGCKLVPTTEQVSPATAPQHTLWSAHHTAECMVQWRPPRTTGWRPPHCTTMCPPPTAPARTIPPPTPFKQKRSGPHRIETLNAHGASSSNGRVHSPRAVRPLSLPPPTPLSTAAGARHPVLAAQGRGLGPELCGKRPARILRRSVALLSLWERQCLPVARVTLHCLFTAFPCICNDSSLPCTFIRIDLPAYSFFAGLSSLCERHQNKSRALGWSSHLQSHRTDTNPGCLANPIP